jgi:Na+-translocating ferredoxin:NAD+ oxidoreductase RnfA subunit
MPFATFDTLSSPVLVHSIAFDALATLLLPKEVMYLNRFAFFIWIGRFFQFTVIKKRSSTYKSLGKLLNQTDDRI